MKTKLSLLLVVALFAGATAFSQTTFGIRGGVNFTNINGRDALDNKLENKLRTGFNAGVNVEIPVGTDFYLQPGVLFTTKGANADGNSDDYISLSYVEIPVNFLYKPALGTGRILLGFGPYAAFAVSGKTKILGVENDIEFGDQPGELKSFDAGANFLAGYEFSNRFSAQLNAGLGLVKINNEVNNNDKTDFKNTTFGVSLGYRFGN